jgi:CRISP-associated protein Cas1
MVLLGRLGLDSARIPHVDRHGVLGLDRGKLSVQNGCLHFISSGGQLDAGEYSIPHQGISAILIGPGTSITHDVLRLLAAHGTALIATGTDGIRCYTAPPIPSGFSHLARRQATLWGDPSGARIEIARQMYAWRLSEVLPHTDIATLRGIEGARMKRTYRLIADQYGIRWKGRRYDRSNPLAADLPNQAINHAATAVEAAATIAVYATSTIPQLGFIHEDASISFILDIADLFRDSITLPLAFEASALCQKNQEFTVDQMVRRLAAKHFRKSHLIPQMIDRIKELFSN